MTAPCPIDQPDRELANGGAAFTDPRSLSPARPRGFYAGMKVTF